MTRIQPSDACPTLTSELYRRLQLRNRCHRLTFKKNFIRHDPLRRARQLRCMESHVTNILVIEEENGMEREKKERENKVLTVIMTIVKQVFTS